MNNKENAARMEFAMYFEALRTVVQYANHMEEQDLKEIQEAYNKAQLKRCSTTYKEYENGTSNQ